MPCATVKDMRKLIENASDDDVLWFEIASEDEPEKIRFSSDVADANTFTARGKYGKETSDGTRNVLKVSLCLDLEPVE